MEAVYFTFCDVYEADILKIPLKITSVKEIYLQLEKKNIYKTTLTLKHNH